MKHSPATQAYLDDGELVADHVPEELLSRTRFDAKALKPLRYAKMYGLQHQIECIYGHKHRKGFVVEFEDGYFGVMGVHCTAKCLGKDVAALLKTDFRRRRNIQQAIKTAAPAILRSETLITLLENLRPVATAKDKFFASIAEHDGIWGALRRATTQTRRGTATIDADLLFNVNHCITKLRSSLEYYRAPDRTTETMAKGETEYMAAARIIRGILEDLLAAEPFFVPLAMQTHLRLMTDDREWTGRARLDGKTLEVNGRRYDVPFHIHDAVVNLSGVVDQINTALTPV